MAALFPIPANKLRIGFVSTRLGTTDGVSLETEKWTAVLNRLGHQSFFFAGLCDRPIVLNDYTIHAIDMKPKGFRAIELDGFITEEAVAQVARALRQPALAAEMAEHNFQLAKRFYWLSYLQHQLQGLVRSFTGEEVRS